MTVNSKFITRPGLLPLGLLLTELLDQTLLRQNFTKRSGNLVVSCFFLVIYIQYSASAESIGFCLYFEPLAAH